MLQATVRQVLIKPGNQRGGGRAASVCVGRLQFADSATDRLIALQSALPSGDRSSYWSWANQIVYNTWA